MVDRMKVEGKHNSEIQKTKREMAEKQQRNAKIGVSIKPVSVCFSLGSLSGKHHKPHL